MNQTHLIKIINSVPELAITQETFDSFYSTNIDGLSISEDIAKKCLTFDYVQNYLTYKSGRINACGLKLEFRHDQFPDILVDVSYHFLEKKLINSVLAIPKYTQKDMVGKKSIFQKASVIKSDKDLQKLFARLRKRFECPVIKQP